MIVDITNEILTSLKTTLSPIKVTSSYQPTSNTFPIVVCEETDNTDHQQSKDSSGFNHCDITINIEIYTNGPNRMSEAKSIRSTIDSVISGSCGLARISQRPVPNFNDSDIFRYQITYVGVVDKNKQIYRR